MIQSAVPTTAPTTTPGLLFTAFEPSGDEHAAVVIAELRARYPSLPIYAWGGRRMAEAGAEVIERTGDDAVMGLPGWKKVREHRRLNARVDAWLGKGLASVHVPVDSPAANFPICAHAKRHGLKVVHLVAPQVWAWGSWRIRKLRRLSDHVLCVLPFEESWFRARGVQATFVGHPLFVHALDGARLEAEASELPTGRPRVALLPGSRPAELERNLPVLMETLAALKRDHPGLSAAVAASNERAAEALRGVADARGGWPEGLALAVGRTDAVLHWADAAVVASGTVTLQVARHNTPMVIFYKSGSRLLYSILAPLLFETEFFTLPNLIAGEEIAPEFVPLFSGSEPVIASALALVGHEDVAAEQRERLAKVVAAFADRRADALAADAIAEMAGLPALEPAVAAGSGV